MDWDDPAERKKAIKDARKAYGMGYESVDVHRLYAGWLVSVGRLRGLFPIKKKLLQAASILQKAIELEEDWNKDLKNEYYDVLDAQKNYDEIIKDVEEDLKSDDLSEDDTQWLKGVLLKAIVDKARVDKKKGDLDAVLEGVKKGLKLVDESGLVEYMVDLEQLRDDVISLHLAKIEGRGFWNRVMFRKIRLMRKANRKAYYDLVLKYAQALKDRGGEDDIDEAARVLNVFVSDEEGNRRPEQRNGRSV